MSSNVCVSFDVSTTNAEAQLGFEAWIDDHKFFDSDHIKNPEKIQTKLPDAEGTHELRLILKNKTQHHTRLDQAGQILSDARLVIENMAFDEIALGHVFIEQTSYTHDFNGSGTVDVHRFFGEMGCNGTVSLKFTTPVYLWLLENM